MAGKFKILILLVALVALPLRGMAAVAMWHCAQDQRDAMSVSGDQHHASHGVHGEATGQSDHHDHEALTHEGATGEHSTPAASACSACAACCMGGTVLPLGWSAFSVAPVGAARIAFVERHVTGVVPAQLERPPLVRSL